MTNEENSPSEETVTDAADVTASEGSENVTESQAQALTLDELNETLGRNYTSKEQALKSIRDTQNYVGKVGQETQEQKPQPEAQAQPEQPQREDYVSRKEFDEATFFAKHPEYEEHKELITSLRDSQGKTLNDVVTSDSFKAIYDKAHAFDENEKAKSVIESNPRLGKATNKMQKAAEALKEGNYEGAKSTAIDAVLDQVER